VHGAPDAGGAQAEPPFVPCPADAPTTTTRAELQAFLDRGLPDLLARMHTAPVLDRQGPGARFVGFRLVALADDLRCGPFGLREGDIVTAVNGHGIERPEDALAVWEQLYEATTISLSLLRGGIEQEAVLTVEDEPVRIDNSGVTLGDASP
jgi:type II secretory pathway component PulC